jgi:hypothetical protein
VRLIRWVPWESFEDSCGLVVSTLTYLGFVSAHILNSWFPIKKNVYLVHAIQPCLTLCFCAALFVWWKRQLLNGAKQACSASDRSELR